MTEWKAVPGFPNYECTQDGRVRSIARFVKRKSGNYNKPDVELSPTKHGTGYRYFLRNEGVAQTLTLQRILYTTWIGTIPDGYCVVIDDNSKAATVDNIKLKYTGVIDYSEHGTVEEKKPAYELDGYCELIGKFLRMRYECS